MGLTIESQGQLTLGGAVPLASLTISNRPGASQPAHLTIEDGARLFAGGDIYGAYGFDLALDDFSNLTVNGTATLGEENNPVRLRIKTINAEHLPTWIFSDNTHLQNLLVEQTNNLAWLTEVATHDNLFVEQPWGPSGGAPLMIDEAHASQDFTLPTFSLSIQKLWVDQDLTVDFRSGTFGNRDFPLKEIRIADGKTLTLPATPWTWNGHLIDLGSTGNVVLQGSATSKPYISFSSYSQMDPITFLGSGLTVVSHADRLSHASDVVERIVDTESGGLNTETALYRLTLESAGDLQLQSNDTWQQMPGLWHITGNVTVADGVANTFLNARTFIDTGASFTGEGVQIENKSLTIPYHLNNPVHVYAQVDIAGRLSAQSLTLPEKGAVVVHAGGTLAVNQVTFSGSSDDMNDRPRVYLQEGGILRSPVPTGWGADVNPDQVGGIWMPDLGGNTYTVSDWNFVNRFQEVHVESGKALSITGTADTGTKIGFTVENDATLSLPASTITKWIDVAGTLHSQGTLTFPAKSRLILHTGTNLAGATIALNDGAEVESDVAITGSGTNPAWYSALAPQLGRTTLVTTQTFTAMDASAFKDWSVMAKGTTAAQKLPATTRVFANSTLKLDMRELAADKTIDNYGVVSFDKIALKGTINGGGTVKKVGTDTATIETNQPYAGRTSIEAGILKMKRGTALTSNVTVKGGAVFYPSIADPVQNEADEETPETPEVAAAPAARRLLSSAALSNSLTPTSRSNSLTVNQDGIVRIDVTDGTQFTRHALTGNLHIGEHTLLEIVVPSNLTLAPNTLLEGVFTWGGYRETENQFLWREAVENENFDFTVIYDDEHRRIDLQVVQDGGTGCTGPGCDFTPPPPCEGDDCNPPDCEGDECNPPDCEGDNCNPPPHHMDGDLEHPILNRTVAGAMMTFSGDVVQGVTMRSTPGIRSDAETGHALWVNLLGSVENRTRGLHGIHGSLGLRADQTGVVMGAESLQNTYRAGLFVAGAQMNGRATDPVAHATHDVKTHGWLVGLYGDKAISDRVTLNAHVAYGKTHFKGERRFDDDGLTAKMSARATQFLAGVGVSGTLDGIPSVVPFVSLDYTRVHAPAYEETGGGVHDQRLPHHHYESLVMRAGATWQKALSGTVDVSVRASAGLDMMAHDHQLWVHHVETGKEGWVKSSASGSAVGDLALGFSWTPNKDWNLRVDLTGEARRHEYEGAAQLQVRRSF